MQLNVKNFYFFVAYDKEIIKHALSKEYGNFAEKYLEKIIQVDFSVPYILGEKLKTYFISELAHLFKRLEIIQDIVPINNWWDYYGLAGYFQNIRQIKIYLNNLSFRLPHVKEEVYIPDFVVLEAVRTFDHETYLLIFNTFSKFFNWMQTTLNAPTVKENIESIQNLDSKLIVQHFYDSYNHKKHYTYDTTRRLLDKKYFEKYFSLDIPQAEFADEEMRIFLRNDANRIEILIHILKYGRFKRFLDKLTNSNFDKIFELPDYHIIESIIDFNPNDDGFVYSYWEQIEKSIDNILALQESKSNAIDFYVKKLIEDNGKLNYCQFYLLYSLCRQLNNNFKDIYRSHRSSFLKHEDKLLAAIKNLTINHTFWLMDGFLNNTSGTDFKFRLFEIIVEYNQFKFNELQKKHFDDSLLCIDYAKYFTMSTEEEKKPITYDPERISRTIPSAENLMLFKSALQKLENDSDFICDKKYISYILDIDREDISDREKPSPFVPSILF